MPGQEFYHDDEAERILSEAVRLSSTAGDGMTRDRLLATASELGISPDLVARAEQNVLARVSEESRAQGEAMLRRQFAGEVRRRHRLQWSSWLSTSATCLGINLFFAGWRIPGISWAWWVVGIYGLVCLKELIELALSPPEKDEQGFERWRARRRLIEDRLGVVGLNLVTMDAYLETKLQSGIDEAVNLAEALRSDYRLSEEDAKIAVLNFGERNPALISKYGVDMDM